MILLASAPAWLAALLLLLMLLAALEDAWRMEISNWTSAAVAIGAFVAVYLNGPVIGFWENLLLFVGVLVIGTFLFARGAMGGGDIKLMAAAALWFDLASGWKLLVAIAIAGGIETLLILGLRKLPWPDGVRRKGLLLQRRGGIPYGIAIALGVALMAYWLRS